MRRSHLPALEVPETFLLLSLVHNATVLASFANFELPRFHRRQVEAVPGDHIHGFDRFIEVALSLSRRGVASRLCDREH